MRNLFKIRTRYLLRNRNVFLLLKNIGILLIVVVAGAIGVLFFEYKTGIIKNLFDAIWWSLVTITTVGYGDLYPVTFWGRIIGIVFILLGFIVFSTFTAFIASNFIDKKIKERKGLSNIKGKNHILIAGWNNASEKILDFIQKNSPKQSISVVLINELEEGPISSLQNKYPDLEIKFIKGDFTNLEIMLKGNVTVARHIILLFDESKPNTTPSDERTIIAAHNLYDLKLQGLINIQLKDKKYIPNLRREKIKNIIVFDDVGGNLLANATVHPSVPDFIQQALKYQDGKGFKEVAIPGEFISKTFLETAKHFKKNNNFILVGIVTIQPDFSIENVLSDDTSSIDRFIKQQFELSGKRMSVKEPKSRIKIKPDDDYIIQETDKAIVL